MGYSTMLAGQGFEQPYRSVKEIVEYLKNNPNKTESEIQEDVFDYFRNETWVSNKKYADMLRRGLAKGYYKRYLWKMKSDSRPLYRYYVPSSAKKLVQVINTTDLSQETLDTLEDVMEFLGEEVIDQTTFCVLRNSKGDLIKIFEYRLKFL